MYYKVVALDLDGTIAMHDQVEQETWTVLRAVKEAGYAIVLVTGRHLAAIDALGSFEDLCEAIVAEDGAAILFPSTQSVLLPFGQLAPEVWSKLKALDIPLEKGTAIVSTWTPHDQAVMQVLSDTGFAASIEFNKGAVMVMPPGATKGTGLLVALEEMGYSPHNVIAFGDAENDRSLFQQVELAVAVENATPGIKALADVHLAHSNGKGVRTFLRSLLEDARIANQVTRSDKLITLGRRTDGAKLKLKPTAFTAENIGIFGASGSGKSWLSGLIAEKLLHLEYQICIIDPEGDYRGLKAFSNTLLLGGADGPPPHGSEVSVLLEYSNLSLVLDLSLYDHAEKRKYVSELLGTLSYLRARRGKPHWFLFDEIHYFCSSDDDPITRMLLDGMQDGGYTIVSYRPSMIAPSVLQRLDHLMSTRMELASEIEVLQRFAENRHFAPPDDEQLRSVTQRQAYLLVEGYQRDLDYQGIVEFAHTRRKVPHIRHLHKYLRAPLPQHKRFHFNTDQTHAAPLSASSIHEFVHLLPEVPLPTLRYHLERGDFEHWFRRTLHDEELARRMRKIAHRQLSDDRLRKSLLDAVSSRYEELERLI